MDDGMPLAPPVSSVTQPDANNSVRHDAADAVEPSQPKLLAEAVSKTFQGRGERQSVLVLDDFSCTVQTGEFLSIVGPSGCGKSTFLRMVAGLERPSAGRVLVDDRPIAGPDPSRGVLFQSYALFPWKTVRQNVEFGPRVRAVPKERRREIVQHYLELVGLEKFSDHYPHEISGGMQQRCALARLLANDPDILLMDEPLAALDELTRRRLQEELLRVWAAEQASGHRKTVIYITHSVEEAVFLSDRVIVMTPRPGRVQDILPIHLERPRDASTREDARYVELVARIWRELGI